MTAYYNDNEPYVVQWLKNLADAKHITPGMVDDRDIRTLTAEDVKDYTRAHFFAGIGGWDYALQLAGWPAGQPVWTGSCPCQPFSVAGKRKGAADERYLWPEWYKLIAECRPPTIFGEQVASADGRKWLDGVFTDLEKLGYAVAGADLCAAGCGAPHIRQRLWWVANTRCVRLEGLELYSRPRTIFAKAESLSVSDFWNVSNRPPLRVANELPVPVGQVRAYGNSIVSQVAATFIQAFLETQVYA